MANTGFRGIDVRQTDSNLMFRAFLLDELGQEVTSGTASLYLYELQSDGTLKSYDFDDDLFKTTALTTETASMTHQTGNNGTTDTGIWTHWLNPGASFTPGAVYLAKVTHSDIVAECREFQFGEGQGDMRVDLDGKLTLAPAQSFSTTGSVGSVSIKTGYSLASSQSFSTSGSVGSVTGAVGSVTGSVASVTGSVGSVTGNVGGNVTGSVGSVVGTVASVTGSVGSVTGSVGSVTGSVGSVTADVTVGDYASGKSPADLVLVTPSQPIATDVSGNVSTTVTGDVTVSAASITAIQDGLATSAALSTLQGDVDALPAAADVASAILITPANKLATDGTGNVTAATVSDKTGYSLSASQSFSTSGSVGSVTGNVGGSVASVTADVGITQTGADKVWGSTTRTLSAFGFAVDISTAAVASIWDAALSGISAAGSIGKMFVDKLSGISGQVASQAEVLSISNTTQVRVVSPTSIELPDTGTENILLEIYLYDGSGGMQAPDSTPTLAVRNQAGTDRSGNLGTVTLAATGHYQCTYTVSSTDALEQLTFEWAVTKSSSTSLHGGTTQIVDTTAVDFTSADRTVLNAIAANADAKVSTRLASADYTTPPTAAAIATQVDTTLTGSHSAGSWGTADTSALATSASLAAMQSDVTTIKGNVDATISSRAPAATAISNATWTDARAANLDHLDANISDTAAATDLAAVGADVDTLVTRVDVTLSTRAAAATALSNVTWTDARAGKVDNLDAAVSSRLATSGYTVPPTTADIATAVWSNATRSLTSFGTLVSDITASVWAAAATSLITVGSIGKMFVDRIDAAVSSRLASSGYTAPDNASILAVKAKTDNLPDDPATETTLATLLKTSNYVPPPSAATISTQVASDLAAAHGAGSWATAIVSGLATSSSISTLQASADAIKAKTDNLPTDPASVTAVNTRLAASAYTAPPTVVEVSTQVAADLLTAHGSGDWTTATGFAVAGDAMTLTAGTISSVQSGLATSAAQALIAADVDDLQGAVAAVKAKTDAIPVDPATETTLATLLKASDYTAPPSAATIASTVGSTLTAAHGSGSWSTADVSALATAAAVGTLQTTATAIKSKSDLIPNDPATETTLATLMTSAAYTAPPNVGEISARVIGDLATDHGSGSWTTATGFATSAALTTAQAGISAIKGKTDNLPADPASNTTVNTRLGAEDYTAPPTVDAISAKVLTDIEAAHGSGSYTTADVSSLATAAAVGTLQTDVTAVKAKTDLIPADPATESTLATLFKAADYVTPPTAAAISTKVNADLSAAHGSGSYTTATGFAVAGDSMGLTAGAISAIQSGLATASALATVDTVVDGLATTLGIAGAGLTGIPKTGYKLSADGVDLVVVHGKKLTDAVGIIAGMTAGLLSGADGSDLETLTFKGLDKLTTVAIVQANRLGNRTGVEYP